VSFQQRRSPRFNNVLANPSADSGSTALTGTSPASAWTVAALALAAGAVALSGTSPASTWTTASINVVVSPVALTGTSPAATWTVPSLALAPGAVALSGTTPVATWTVPSLAITTGTVLTGTIPAATWTVPALALSAGSAPLSGSIPAATWAVAAIQFPSNVVPTRDDAASGPLLPPRQPKPTPVLTITGRGRMRIGPPQIAGVGWVELPEIVGSGSYMVSAPELDLDGLVEDKTDADWSRLQRQHEQDVYALALLEYRR